MEGPVRRNCQIQCKRCWKRATATVKDGYDGTMALLDSSEDPDRLLSYYTRQQVRFLDRKLGITFNCALAFILLYIIGYMFIYQKGYLEHEQAKGGVVTHIHGDVLSTSTGKPGTRYFSADDLSYPGLENGNVFVTTRQAVHKQKLGVCADYAVACAADTDCTPGGGGHCDQELGVCVEKAWCDEETLPEVYELDSGEVQIWTRSTIQFIKLAPDRVFSTEQESNGPRRGYNTFSVREILMLVDPLPVRYEEVAELGAFIEVQFFWECNVVSEKKCHPTVKARRLDTVFDPDNIGYSFAYPEHIDDYHRVRNNVRGIRISFRTAGQGRRFSLSSTINKASLGAALFSLAQIIADLLMTKVFALKQKYKARKFVISPDFSDHIKIVEARQKEIKSDAEIAEIERKVTEKEERWMQMLHESDNS